MSTAAPRDAPQRAFEFFGIIVAEAGAGIIILRAHARCDSPDRHALGCADGRTLYRYATQVCAEGGPRAPAVENIGIVRAAAAAARALLFGSLVCVDTATLRAWRSSVSLAVRRAPRGGGPSS